MESAEPPYCGVDWLQTWESPRTGIFRIGRTREDWFAEWVGIARLRASRDGSRVQFDLVPGCDEAWGLKLRHGLAAALVSHLSGGVTLHAAAVGLNEGSVLLLGESGAGKSTLAADLCERGGAMLLSDDTAALSFHEEGVAVCPTEQVNWLSPDARAHRGDDVVASDRKVPVLARNIAAIPLSLRAMVKLVFDETSRRCRLVPLAGRSAFSVLNGAHIRFAIAEPAVTLRDFEMLGRLKALVPVYELRRPRGLGALRESREVVAGLLRR